LSLYYIKTIDYYKILREYSFYGIEITLAVRAIHFRSPGWLSHVASTNTDRPRGVEILNSAQPR